MNHCGYEFDHGEHSEKAIMYLHSVLQVCARWIVPFAYSISLSHLSSNLCFQDGTAQGHPVAYLEGRDATVQHTKRKEISTLFCVRSLIEIQTKVFCREFRKNLNEVCGCLLLWAELSYSSTPRSPGSKLEAAEGQNTHCKKCPLHKAILSSAIY